MGYEFRFAARSPLLSIAKSRSSKRKVLVPCGLRFCFPTKREMHLFLSTDHSFVFFKLFLFLTLF